MSKLTEELATKVVATPVIDGIIEKGKSYYEKGEPRPSARIERITPEISAEWLTRNGLPVEQKGEDDPAYRNRPIKPMLIAHYSRMMTNGDWMVNGETIILGVGGELLDGQNRLYACISAGIPFYSFVVRGIPYAAFDTINTGRVRSASDIIAIHGAEYATWIAGGVRTLEGMQTGLKDGSSRVSPLDTVRRWLKSEVSGGVSYTDSAHAIRGAVNAKIIRPSVAFACHQLFSEKDPKAADAFFLDLWKGLGLGADDPVYHLRRRLELAAMDKRRRLINDEVAALCIHAWNSRREGKKTSRLQGMAKRKDGSYSPPAVE